jgi:glycosyltransferase involved in cell wall biosynthesis
MVKSIVSLHSTEMRDPEIPLVSVILTIRNNGDPLLQSFHSIFKQDICFLVQIIVIELSCSDEYNKISGELQENIPSSFSLTVFRHKKPGSSWRELIGQVSSAIKGKYIAFCDATAYWPNPLKLQHQVDFMENNPDFILSHHQMHLLGDGGRNHNHFSNPKNEKVVSSIADLSIRNFISYSSAMIRNPAGQTIPVWVFDDRFHIYKLFLFISGQGKTKYLPGLCGVQNMKGLRSNNSMGRLTHDVAMEIYRSVKGVLPTADPNFVSGSPFLPRLMTRNSKLPKRSVLLSVLSLTKILTLKIALKVFYVFFPYGSRRWSTVKKALKIGKAEM